MWLRGPGWAIRIKRDLGHVSPAGAWERNAWVIGKGPRSHGDGLGKAPGRGCPWVPAAGDGDLDGDGSLPGGRRIRQCLDVPVQAGVGVFGHPVPTWGCPEASSPVAPWVLAPAGWAHSWVQDACAGPPDVRMATVSPGRGQGDAVPGLLDSARAPPCPCGHGTALPCSGAFLPLGRFATKNVCPR